MLNSYHFGCVTFVPVITFVALVVTLVVKLSTEQQQIPIYCSTKSNSRKSSEQTIIDEFIFVFDDFVRFNFFLTNNMIKQKRRKLIYKKHSYTPSTLNNWKFDTICIIMAFVTRHTNILLFAWKRIFKMIVLFTNIYSFFDLKFR